MEEGEMMKDEMKPEVEGQGVCGSGVSRSDW